MTLPDRLRAAIGSAHAAIEATALARDMLAGRVTREQYADWLVQMSHLHTAVEPRMAACDQLRGLFDPEATARAGVLDRDIAALGVDSDAPPAAPVADLVDGVVTTAELIGTLYVLEGSRMGSLVLARPLARALGVPLRSGVGLDYHLDGAAERPLRWQAFRARLAIRPLYAAEEQQAVSAAVRTMSALHALYEEISAAGSDASARAGRPVAMSV